MGVHDAPPRGKCADIPNPDIFTSDDPDERQQAVTVCKGVRPRLVCDVIEVCLRWALDHDEKDGVWGGMTPRARGRFRCPVAA